MLRYGCVVCGCQIHRHKRYYVDWWMEFRIIYSAPEGFFITGVGRQNDPDAETFRAPSNPLKRWDNDDCEPQVVIPVTLQDAHNGVHGFPVHESCWILLQDFFKPHDVPLRRFVEICESLPFADWLKNVYWGHTYNGLCKICNISYPWYAHLSGPAYGLDVKSYVCYDPLNIPEATWISKSSSFTPYTSIEKRPVRDRFSRDCFWKLPWELREVLAIYLPTEDALDLRRASSAFIPLLNSQTFWASRFRRGGDRDFFLEAQGSCEPRDWLRLYRITGSSQCSPGLQNRRRIWPLLRQFSQLLSLQVSDTLSIPREVLHTQQSNWVSVTGELLQDASGEPPFAIWCRLDRTYRALVPRNITRVAVSPVGSGKYGYITGIRFISASGEVIRLGYISTGNETFVEVSQLNGFTLAMAPEGLKGLKIIDNGLESRWVGFPLDTPVTERLATFKSIEAVEVGVDAFKIVTFAAAGPRMKRPAQFVTSRFWQQSSFLWYPSTPSPELYISKMSLTRLRQRNPQYRALVWAPFGGSKGANLQYLTEIRLIDSRYYLCSIEFHYDQAEHAIETVKLGQHQPMIPFNEGTRFSIDGHGGEHIQKVFASTERPQELPEDEFHNVEQLHSVKITTNTGRSVHFEPEKPSRNRAGPTVISRLREIKIAPGTKITGLYAEQGHRFGLLALGVISEVV